MAKTRKMKIVKIGKRSIAFSRRAAGDLCERIDWEGYRCQTKRTSSPRLVHVVTDHPIPLTVFGRLYKKK